MNVSFDFLSDILDLNDKCINTLCIENQTVFRNTVFAFLHEDPESLNIVFSENFTPIKFKGNVCFIDNIFKLEYSNSVVKKLYENIEKFCNTDLQTETSQLKSNIINYFDLIVKEFDYDIDYKCDIALTDLFKMQSLKPCLENVSILENLRNFIIFISEYTSVKCFVLLNIHLYFTYDEIFEFYFDMLNHHIIILNLESSKNFEKNSYEKIIICDKDMCEILENSEY